MLGLKNATFLAGISIGTNVAGFIPFLADFCLTENEPKPIMITLPFRFISSVMVSMTASSAFLDSVLFNPVFATTALVSSQIDDFQGLFRL